MNKKLVTILGVAAVGVGAYMLWKKSQKPKEVASFSGPKCGNKTCPQGHTCNCVCTPPPSPLPYYKLSSGEFMFKRTSAQGGSLKFPKGSQFFEQNKIWYGCPPYGDCLPLLGLRNTASQRQVDNGMM